MKRFAAVGVVLVGLAAAVVVAVGASLPATHSATVEARMPSPRDEVWSVISDPRAFPTWRTGVDSVATSPDGLDGWTEYSGRDALPLEVISAEPPARLVTRIADDGLPFGGTWTYELSPDAGGTRVRITEDGVIHNPVFRFAARFVLGHDATLRAYLGDLEARLAGGAWG